MTLDEAARVLGVAPSATPAQIEEAYRRRARETHPDRSGSDDAFITVAAARQMLLDAVTRPVPAPPRASPLLLVTWVGVALVAIFVATFRNDWPLPWAEAVVRYLVMLIGLVGYALTGRTVFLVLAIVAIAATAVLTLIFATFGGLVGLLGLVAPIYGLMLMGSRLRRPRSRLRAM